MKVLVTGRHGQVARSLRERGIHHPQLELTFVGRPEVDLVVPGSLANVIASTKPQVVVNAAAYTDVERAEIEPELAFRINAEAAGEAAAAAAGAGAAIIQISTDYVFDGVLDRPYREIDEVRPLNVYGASKLSGEKSVSSANPDHVIARTSWVVSAFGRNFVRTMIGAARRQSTLKVVADQFGRPTSATDLADALIAVLMLRREGRACAGEVFHVAGGGQASWFELASAVMDELRALGAPAAAVQPIASSDWPTMAVRPRNSILDCSRFEQAFGFIMPDWRASLGDIVRRAVEDEVQ